MRAMAAPVGEAEVERHVEAEQVARSVEEERREERLVAALAEDAAVCCGVEAEHLALDREEVTAFADIERGDARPLLGRPHLQDAAARRVNDEVTHGAVRVRQTAAVLLRLDPRHLKIVRRRS